MKLGKGFEFVGTDRDETEARLNRTTQRVWSGENALADLRFRDVGCLSAADRTELVGCLAHMTRAGELLNMATVAFDRKRATIEKDEAEAVR